MTDWYDENDQLLSDLAEKLDEVPTALDDADLVGVATGCALLKVTVADLREAEPMPVSSVNMPWAQAVAAYGDGAELCLVGVANLDLGRLDEGAARLDQGFAKLDEGAAHEVDVTEALDRLAD